MTSWRILPARCDRRRLVQHIGDPGVGRHYLQLNFERAVPRTTSNAMKEVANGCSTPGSRTPRSPPDQRRTRGNSGSGRAGGDARPAGSQPLQPCQCRRHRDLYLSHGDKDDGLGELAAGERVQVSASREPPQPRSLLRPPRGQPSHGAGVRPLHQQRYRFRRIWATRTRRDRLPPHEIEASSRAGAMTRVDRSTAALRCVGLCPRRWATGFFDLLWLIS